MGTILKLLGVLALIVIAGVVALLVWAAKSGAAAQDKFFLAVVSGDPQQVLAMSDPELQSEVDAPVLAAWMKAVKTNLGAYKGLSNTDFHTNSSSTGGVTTIESKGTVNFEHGDATSEVTFRNDKLVGFHIKSDKLKGDWYQGIDDGKLYRERGEEFIRRFFAKDGAAAVGLMDDDLKKNSPLEKLQPILEESFAENGPLKSVTFHEEKFWDDEGSRMLTVAYKIATEKKEFTGELQYKFAALRGSLIGFEFTPVKK